ncbi:MAG TPA: GNAT family N-acetyltransferase [Tepidisphaeraceae bacterium]|jgi:tagatose 1,6-diphosphate aldolase|nr:GNAT family N-acetyltransferase [Tepidisphaeraceae bacterium]
MDLEAGFAFLDPGPLRDGELELVLTRRAPGDIGNGRVPSYWFTLRIAGKDAGMINLRIGGGFELEQYDGHFAYTVYPRWRGRHYARRACMLLFPLARAHGMQTLWITCHPDNHASRRTCEGVGAVLMEIVTRPPAECGEVEIEGDRERCRYRIDLTKATA